MILDFNFFKNLEEERDQAIAKKSNAELASNDNNSLKVDQVLFV
jgi:hypothetical protein